MVVKNLEKDREKARTLAESKNFSSLIIFLILLDSLILGALASPMVKAYLHFELFLLDRLVVAIFICEMLIKLYAYGFNFFKKGWNILDLLVVVVSIIPSTSYFVVLRSFRLLRLLRYLDKNMKVVQFLGIMKALLPSFFSAVSVYCVFLYIFAILGVGFFGTMFLEYASLEEATSSLLQLVFLQDSAFEVANFVVMKYSQAWIFFTSFMLSTMFLFVSFIVSGINDVMHYKEEN